MDKAILITYDKEDAINEAKGLCEAAGYEVVHIIQENYLQKPKYGISGGVLEKLQEIDGKLGYFNLAPIVAKTFKIMGISSYSELYESEDEALTGILS